MKHPLLHRAARAELDDAIGYYDRREPELGREFLLEVELALTQICERPEAWPPHRRTGLRKHFVRRFPFVIFYLELPDYIWVAAIAHGSRRPDYWKGRQPDVAF